MGDDLELADYPIRICVAGSRSFHVPELFDAYLRVYLSWAGIDNYAFISGAAWRGPDKMIIDWARENEKECFEFPANWEKYGRGAGFRRNADMRKALTHLLVFWDGESKGTLEMINKTRDMEDVHVAVILVEPDPQWIEYMRKKQLRGDW